MNQLSGAFRIQMMDPESELFLNTNHVSHNFESLKAMLEGTEFPGGTFQVIDGDFRVCFGPIFRERETVTPVEDVAEALGVPVLDARGITRAQHEDGVSIVGVVIIVCLACFVMYRLFKKFV